MTHECLGVEQAFKFAVYLRRGEVELEGTRQLSRRMRAKYI